jgi:hypothetical protein
LLEIIISEKSIKILFEDEIVDAMLVFNNGEKRIED